MAKILMVHPGPDFSVADVFRGWEKALKKQGHKVMTYNTNDRLTFYGRAVFEEPDQPPCEHCGRLPVHKAAPEPLMVAKLATAGLFEDAVKFRPDICFFVSAFFHTADTFQAIRSLGIKIVMLHTESPYQDDEQMRRGYFAHLNLINDPVNIGTWKDLGPVAYMPHSYDPEVHYPPKTRNYELDFAFIGTSFLSRLKFFSAMNFDGIATAFGGNGWDTVPEEYQHLWRYLGHRPDECVDNTETARIYRMAKCGINFYRREGEDTYKGAGYAMGPREVEMAACGLFFLRDRRPESDEVFGGNRYLATPDILPVFESPEDAEEKLRWWIAHDSLREKRAAMAREAIEDRTFDNRAEEVAEILEELKIL